MIRGRQLELVLPELLVVEVAGALARTRGDTRAADVFARALHAIAGVRFVALDDALATEALALAATHRLRGADAVYAAVAVRYGTTLVSLDREHLTRLAGVLPILTPADAQTVLLPHPAPDDQATR